MGTTILLASHLLDEVEKVCSHVVIIRKGIKLYSGRVDEMNASHGFFELKANDLVKLQQLLEEHPSIGKITLNEDLLTAILEEPMGADDLNSFLHQRGMVLSYLVKRKESLEEQFLQLTNETAL
jgi:ABC-2 type transport system ATP-binding protein